tara:strand:- start:731 stop:1906 length:1176 start_codon:yes stop_codon:yes gene_type:complete
MAEKEEPIANDETGKIKVKAKTEKQPEGNETEGNVTKVKAKMKKPAEVIEQTMTKVDLSKPVETKVEEVVEETQPEEVSETPVLQEITEEQAAVEEIAEQAEEAIVKAEVTGEPLPENIQKLVSFMGETGGDLNDYVKLNQDYSEMDNQDILYEHYRQTKPHLNAEEINFLLEDQFSFDEDVDDDREIRRKKLALKEQVASAKSHLDGQKSKYYEDIKMGSKLTSEQQEAINFFNRYNEEEAERQETLEKNTSTFLNKTNNVFNDKFEGFEYTVGDKKFRYSVKDANKVKETQSDINNFVKKFLNKNNVMEDAGGYHKSLFTAMNADSIINHFYEQGKADAMKDSVANAKNVNMSPRQSHGEVEMGGVKVRVLGDSSSDFKFKIKNNKFKK